MRGVKKGGVPRARWGTASQAVAVNIRGVSPALRDSFKAHCAAHGYTMGDALVALMRRAVRDNMSLPEARRVRRHKD